MTTVAAPTRRIYSSWTAPHLLEWRRFRMLTQRQLAAKSNVHLATIVRAEHGATLQHATLKKLAGALKCRVVDLLGDD
jgi:transcriptional regulator with XRE-family HTH domain